MFFMFTQSTHAIKGMILRFHAMKKLLSLILIVLLGATAMAQRYTVSGTIVDKRSGETLIGATVLDTRSGKGTVTNLYGHYSLTLPKDSVALRITFVGYEPQHVRMLLDHNQELNIQLRESVMLEEVTITADRVGDVRSVQMSAMDMPVEKIKAVPVLFGEADVIKALQLMPGVQSGSEGNSGLYVRGGGPDENLFLLDGVPLYNVSHLGGFFSAFNTDAIKNVTLYKGSFPARFGGRKRPRDTWECFDRPHLGQVQSRGPHRERENHLQHLGPTHLCRIIGDTHHHVDQRLEQ